MSPSNYPARLHLGATTIPSRIRVIGYSADQQQSPLRRDPSASRRYLFSTHDHGRPRSNQARVLPHTWPLCGPDGTFSRLFAFVAEEHERPVTQSVATPEPGCPDPHPRSSRGLPRPRVCHHTREPTVLSRVSCRPAPEF